MTMVETYHQLHRELYNIQWKIKTFETLLLEGMELETTFPDIYKEIMDLPKQISNIIKYYDNKIEVVEGYNR